MQPFDYAAFALFRAELQHDYAPANAQERLLVLEVATCWQRLEQARHREALFFDLQKTVQAVRCDAHPEAFKKHGCEVLMWIDHPHKAYDQILHAIRDAGVAFDRAVRRIEQVQSNRRRTIKPAPVEKSKAKAATASFTPAPRPNAENVIELRPPNRENNPPRAPAANPKST